MRFPDLEVPALRGLYLNSQHTSDRLKICQFRYVAAWIGILAAVRSSEQPFRKERPVHSCFLRCRPCGAAALACDPAEAPEKFEIAARRSTCCRGLREVERDKSRTGDPTKAD